MAHVTADFVKETSTTTGTGPIVLGGARAPAQTFSAVCSNGDQVHYAISHDTLNQWEVGTGTYSSGGNSITRSVVLSSSSGGAAVNFAAGTKRVDLVEPAARIVQQVGPVQIGATSFGSGALSFSDLNGVSWGLATNSAGGTITASVGAVAATSLSFALANNVSFGTVGSTLTALAFLPVTFGFVGSQFSNFTEPGMAGATRLNLQGGFTSQHSLFSSINVSFGISGTDRLAAIAAVNVIGGGSTAFAQHFSLQNTNGLLWSVGTTTAIGLGRVGLIQAGVQPHSAPVGNLSFSAYTDSSIGAPGLLFPNGLFQSSAFSFANVSFAFSSQSIGAIAAINFLAGTDTLQGYAQHLSFRNSNGVSWQISTSTFANFGRFAQIFASVEPRLGLVSHVGGNSVGNVTRLVFSDASNVTWSLSTAASAVTVFGSVAAGGGGGADGFGTVSLVSNFSTTSPAITGATDLSISGSLLAFPQQAASLDSRLSYNNVNFRLSSNTVLAGAWMHFIAGSASASADAQNLSFINSFGNSWAMATVTAAGVGLIPIIALRAAIAISAGTSASSFYHSLVLSDSNNVSFGMNGSTLTASASFPAASSLSFSNANGISFGIVGSTLTASYTVPTLPPALAISAAGASASAGTVVFSNANGVTFGQVGSTVTASVAAAGGFTYGGHNLFRAAQSAFQTVDQGSFWIAPLIAIPNFAFDRVVVPVFHTGATNSSGGVTLRQFIAFYTKNGNTLSLAHSTSGSVTISASGTAGNYSLFSAPRLLSMGWTSTIPASDYWVGIGSSLSGGAGVTVSRGMISQTMAASVFGMYGANTNATVQSDLGAGFFGTTTTAPPNSIAFSQINGTFSLAYRRPIIMFEQGTA